MDKIRDLLKPSFSTPYPLPAILVLGYILIVPMVFFISRYSYIESLENPWLTFTVIHFLVGALLLSLAFFSSKRSMLRTVGIYFFGFLVINGFLITVLSFIQGNFLYSLYNFFDSLFFVMALTWSYDLRSELKEGVI